MILRRILQRVGGVVWSGSGQGPVGGSCKHDNESSGSMIFSRICVSRRVQLHVFIFLT
jgi:hypothetical protein